MMSLELIFYLVIILAVICYAMLDGFDLGVGVLHLFGKTDQHRRIFLNAIGPVWDGNEVWLVVIAGSLFAGFPEVFATIFSTFYIPVMILLMGLMYRAVSIEFRSKRDSKKWRKNWDIFFSISSLIISFGVGLILGNLIQGIPLDSNFNFVGSFTDFIHPYPLLVGVMTIALFSMHGGIFLVMKTEGELHDQLRRLVPKLIAFFLIMYTIVTAATFYDKPYMIAPMKAYPWLNFVPLTALIAILFVPHLMKKKQDGWAFLASCFSIALLLSLAVIGTFPYMIRSTISPEINSLTIFNASSSKLTLQVLMIIVGIGIPLIFAYGFFIYRIFRGKVKISSMSY